MKELVKGKKPVILFTCDSTLFINYLAKHKDMRHELK